ncbi:MAG: MBL fold metallo-hydrolase [Gammaproteobacteria bacterium]|nr:MBL fold metallo-hydrolase [Gammaproteobacteria bacterium]
MKKIVIISSILFLLFGSMSIAQATLITQKVSDNVYALVGEMGDRSSNNLGNNSTHGFIVTNEGVILMDSGGSYLGAQQIHQAIQKITDKPVKVVINTGGQDHRWMGNEYFHKLGAKIISSSKTHQDQIARTDFHMSKLDKLIGKSLNGTHPFYSTDTFDSTKIVDFGGVHLELYYFGPAHTIGDIVVWLPRQKIIFAGDIVFNDRMLGIGPAKNFQSWMNTFEKMASLKPEHIIPGHGNPSDLATAMHNTYDYLALLKKEVGKILENDGSMVDIEKIDQSEFGYLKNYDAFFGKNAQWVFEQMEFDF